MKLEMYEVKYLKDHSTTYYERFVGATSLRNAIEVAESEFGHDIEILEIKESARNGVTEIYVK